MKNLLAVLFVLFPAVSWAGSPTLGNAAFNSVTLTTPLAPSSGGLGATGLTGYPYLNGNSAATASVSIPASAITGLSGGGNPVSLQTNAAVNSGATYLPFTNPSSIAVNSIALSTNIPSGDLVAAVSAGTSTTAASAPQATAAGFGLIPVANITGISVGQLVSDSTASGALSSGSVVLAVYGTATTANTVTASGNSAASQYQITTSTNALACTPGMLVYDTTTAGAIPAGAQISQYSSSTPFNQNLRLSVVLAAQVNNGDTIVCYNAAALSSPTQSPGIGSGDSLLFSPAVQLFQATTGVISSGASVQFTPNTFPGLSNVQSISGNLTVGGTVNAGLLEQNGVPVEAMKPTCDFLSGGCIDGWSIVQQLVSIYQGPLFRIYRASPTPAYLNIGTYSNSVMVNLPALHNFCDGYDCYFNVLYDQGTNGNKFVQSSILNMPQLEYDANGLPEMVMNGKLNQWMMIHPTNGLPTSGSRTLYEASDNFTYSPGNYNFAWGAANIYSTGGGGWGFNVAQSSDIQPQDTIFGGFLDYGYNTWGAYPPGYGQLVGVTKYNATSGEAYSGLIPQTTCTSGVGVTCNIYSTWSAPPQVTINTCNSSSDGCYLWLGMGTDGGSYGGRFQTALLANYATLPSEDSAVMNNLSLTHFSSMPSSCAATNTTYSAPITAPSAHTTPQTYVGTIAPNIAFTVGLWSTSLVNPSWTGALFRVRRADTGATKDIYPLGCDANAPAVTTFCTGTTCTVPKVFDQSGHGYPFIEPTVAEQPGLNLTGINGKPCLSFTSADNFMQTMDIWNPYGPTSYDYGLNQGMTLETVYKANSNSNPLGIILMLSSNGFYLAQNSSGAVSYYNGVTFGSAGSTSGAHFAYLTADATPGVNLTGGNQNLAISMDGGTAVTGTFTPTQVENAGGGFSYGIGSYNGSSSPFQGCLAEVAVYNDVESTQNLANMHTVAQNKWATP